MEPMNADDLVAQHLAHLTRTLQRIARGRPDNGRPFAAEDSRQFAREALIKVGLRWPSNSKQK